MLIHFGEFWKILAEDDEAILIDFGGEGWNNFDGIWREGRTISKGIDGTIYNGLVCRWCSKFNRIWRKYNSTILVGNSDVISINFGYKMWSIFGEF